MRVAVVAIGVMALVAVTSAQTFRGRTEVVVLDVLVKNAGVPVSDLVAADFEVRDNGVVQDVTATRADSVPVDLTLVLDVSSSARGLLDSFKNDVKRIAELLRPEDRVRLLSCGGFTTRVFDFQPGNAD